MNMDIIYYIILGITVVSYLLGLFLSHFERKGESSPLSSMGNGGFINIFGVNSSNSSSEQMVQVQQQEFSFQQSAQMSQHPFQSKPVMQLQQQSEVIPQYHQIEQLEDVQSSQDIEVLDFDDIEIL